MDASTRQELNTTIEALTHSGESFLNQDLLRKVKRMCRASDLSLRAAYEMMMTHLSKDHAEIRLASFQLISDLFSRSHLFRQLLISDFQQFSKLVTGVDCDQPLPPPKPISEQLKEKSLLTIRNWNEKFGDGYPKLRLGYNYLKFNRKVNFEELMAQSEAAQRRQQERETRRTVMLEQRIQEIKQEIADMQPDILDCLAQTDSCFNLLLPRFDLPDLYTSIPSTDQLSEEGNNIVVPSTSCCYSERRTTCTSSSSFTSVSSSHENSTLEESYESIQHGSCIPEQTMLASIYGAQSSIASIKNVRASGGTRKGKEKLTIENAECEDTCKTGREEDQSSDSDVEWEDVEPIVKLEGMLEEFPEGFLELQQHGFASHNFSIPVEVTSQFEVVEDENNCNILATLRESRQMLKCVFLPTIMKWIEWLTKAGEQERLRNIINLKANVKSTLEKFKKLKLLYKDPPRVTEDSQQEVDIGMTTIHKTHAEWTFGFDTVTTLPPDTVYDPTTPEAQLAQLKQKISSNSTEKRKLVSSSTPRKNILLNKAPVVPFGMDLFHWENPAELQLISTAQVGSLHRFWVEEHEVDVTEDEKHRLNCRTIKYSGEFKPVQRACRTPLPSGKLCPRRDRYKCPFHGVIVPRDDNGRPVDMLSHGPSSTLENQTLRKDTCSDTSKPVHDEGTSLQCVKVRKNRKKSNPNDKKFPGLTNLKRYKDTSRKRLARKVLNKKSLKKVSQDIDNISSRKYQDKFGYNFNYALNS